MVGLGVAGAAALGAPPAIAAGSGRIGLPPPLRRAVQARMEAGRLPAVAVAVVRNGVPAAVEGLGLASPPFGVAATPSTLFHLGSASKHFTAALVLRLAAAGRIRLGDAVGDYARGLPPSLAGLPISALLSHTAGAPEYEALAGFEGDKPVSREMFLARMGGLPVDFAPGEAWSYSNTGYVLLGYLTADVCGRPYREVVAQELLAPARLREARVDDASAIIPGRAEPHVLADGVLRRAMTMDSDFSGWPDGGMLISARDAARWEAGLQSGEAAPAVPLRTMTTPVLLKTGRNCAYGFGWRLDRVRGREVHYHAGSVPGFMAFYLRIPSERLGVVVTANVQSERARAAVARIAHEAAEGFAPGSTAISLVPMRDPDPALAAEARAMLLRGGRPLDPGRFAPEIACLLGRPAGEKAAPPDRTAAGLLDLNLVEAFDEDGGGHVRRYRCVYADRVEHMAFAYARDGRIYRVRAI